MTSSYWDDLGWSLWLHQSFCILPIPKPHGRYINTEGKSGYTLTNVLYALHIMY